MATKKNEEKALAKKTETAVDWWETEVGQRLSTEVREFHAALAMGAAVIVDIGRRLWTFHYERETEWKAAGYTSFFGNNGFCTNVLEMSSSKCNRYEHAYLAFEEIRKQLPEFSTDNLKHMDSERSWRVFSQFILNHKDKAGEAAQLAERYEDPSDLSAALDELVGRKPKPKSDYKATKWSADKGKLRLTGDPDEAIEIAKAVGISPNQIVQSENGVVIQPPKPSSKPKAKKEEPKVEEAVAVPEDDEVVSVEQLQEYVAKVPDELCPLFDFWLEAHKNIATITRIKPTSGFSVIRGELAEQKLPAIIYISEAHTLLAQFVEWMMEEVATLDFKLADNLSGTIMNYLESRARRETPEELSVVIPLPMPEESDEE